MTKNMPPMSSRTNRFLMKSIRHPLSLLLVVFLLFSTASASGAELHLALADSTCSTMKEIGKIFAKKSGISLTYTCKSSGLLAKGIKAGVINADFFLSANKKWMEKLVQAKIVDEERVMNLLANQLVLAAMASCPIELTTLEELASPKVKKLIIGDPGKAPFGRYAKQALQDIGLWQAVRSKIITRKKISLAIKSIKEGEMGTFGVLYKTSLDEGLLLHLVIPQSLHDPINYYAAPINNSVSKEGMAEFLSFLNDSESRQIFKEAGFIPQL